MMDISAQRCTYHAHREAVARCPSCHHFYCRECITEHESRMLCATCLSRQAGSRRGQRRVRRVFRALTTPLALVTGLVAAWLFFQLLGAMLVRLPAAFHDGRPAAWFEPIDG